MRAEQQFDIERDSGLGARRAGRGSRGEGPRGRQTSSVRPLRISKMRSRLEGFSVAVVGGRRTRELAMMIEESGAAVVSLEGVDLDPAPELEALTERVCSQPPDVVVLTTDAGLSLWLEAADAVNRRAELLGALSRAELLVRGPKVAGAAAVAGLAPTWCGNGTVGELESELESRELRGRRVLVQLPPGSAPELLLRLGRRGASVVRAVPYTHTMASPDGLNRIVAVALSGELDALVVTNRPVAEALLEVAGDNRPRFLACANSEIFSLFCLGQASARVFAGASPMLPSAPRLGTLARLVTQELPARASLDLGQVKVRGRVVSERGRRVSELSPREAGVLRLLAANQGRVVPRQEVISLLWSGAPGSARSLEVSISRLRASLGSASAAVVTVPRRGYMLDPPRSR